MMIYVKILNNKTMALFSKWLDKAIKKTDKYRKVNRKKSDLAADYKRKAKPAGKRISKNGNVYYENRANRSDSKTRI